MTLIREPKITTQISLPFLSVAKSANNIKTSRGSVYCTTVSIRQHILIICCLFCFVLFLHQTHKLSVASNTQALKPRSIESISLSYESLQLVRPLIFQMPTILPESLVLAFWSEKCYSSMNSKMTSTSFPKTSEYESPPIFLCDLFITKRVTY